MSTTENLFQKVEDKMMAIVDELDRLRKENLALKAEKENSSRKLQELVSLLDSINGVTSTSLGSTMNVIEPLVAQG